LITDFLKQYGYIIAGVAFVAALFIAGCVANSDLNNGVPIPREIATRVPRKLIKIPARIKRYEEPVIALRVMRDRHLPTNPFTSRFRADAIDPNNPNVPSELYDEAYRAQYEKWMEQFGGMENVPDSIKRNHPDGFEFVITDPYSKRFKPATQALLSRCKPVDGFDMPVGAPDGKGYYIAQLFGNSSNHLGEDWNGVGGGNSDLGDPVYAIADGAVYWSKINKGSWGNIVRIIHNIGTVDEPRYIESLYAHLDTVMVWEGQELLRGQQIGTIGDAHKNFQAHLHLEIRKQINTPIGKAYTTDTTGFHYRRPLPFIEKRRPAFYKGEI